VPAGRTDDHQGQHPDGPNWTFCFAPAPAGGQETRYGFGGAAICGANDREQELTLSGGVLSWPDGWVDPLYERQEQVLNGRFSTLPAGPRHRRSRALPKAFFLFSGLELSPRPGLCPLQAAATREGRSPSRTGVWHLTRSRLRYFGDVHLGPLRSRPVAVLSCCTHHLDPPRSGDPAGLHCATQGPPCVPLNERVDPRGSRVTRNHGTYH
jgi:hypothetical protein